MLCDVYVLDKNVAQNIYDKKCHPHDDNPFCGRGLSFLYRHICSFALCAKQHNLSKFRKGLIWLNFECAFKNGEYNFGKFTQTNIFFYNSKAKWQI